MGVYSGNLTVNDALNSYLAVRKLVFDRHPDAGIYSHRPIGLGSDALKSEIPGFSRRSRNIHSVSQDARIGTTSTAGTVQKGEISWLIN